MKKLLAAMFVALLMFGCGEKPGGEGSLVEPLTSAETIDLDDNETRNRIMAEVVDYERLQRKSKESEELAYASDQQKPYKGWAKFSDATSVPMGAFYAYVTKVQ